jgi:glycerophosphoryl diester phosphodiesterase
VIDLLRRDGIIRVGHKGAAALAPENTLRSLEKAIEVGVDVVEFDVIDSLVLAHSHDEIPQEPASLDQALALMRPHGVGLHVDVKSVGVEREIVEALRRHELLDRAYVTSVEITALHRFAELEPGLPRGLSYPPDHYDVLSGWALAPVRLAGAAALRQVLPRRIAGLLERAQATIASLHYGVISRATVERCHALGIPVIAWTVDSPALLARVQAAGVDAVVSNDPRIFGATLSG